MAQFDPNNLDQNVVNLARAIRQIETGNRPVKGASGELASRYQYMPSTWSSTAAKYLGDANAPLTAKNEDQATYLKIKDWKDAGYTPKQIASMWNSGQPDWEGKVGVNSAGVKYDVPKYVDKVWNEFVKVSQANPIRALPAQAAPLVPGTANVDALGQGVSSQYQGMSIAPKTPAAQPQQKGFLREVGEAVVRPFAELGVSAVNLGKNIASLRTGENKDYSEQTYNLPFLGQTKPAFTGGENFGEFTKKTLGYGAEIGSYGIGAGTAGKVASAGIKGMALQAARTGIKEGAIIGAAQGAGMTLREGGTVGESLKQGAIGALGGAALGGALGAGSAALSGGVKKLASARAQAAAEKVDKFLGQVFQGKPEDIKMARRALTDVDLSGIKTYKDLTRALNDQIKGIKTTLDSALDKKTGRIVLDNLNTITEVDGRQIVANFAKDAIGQLGELYAKTNDSVGLARIQSLLQKANQEGLTVRELNDLAVRYGQEFKKKAFSKLGDPLTSVNAQNYENTRKGIKDLARRIFGEDAYRMADEEMTNIIRVRDLSGKLVNKVNDLKQKINKRGFGENVGRLLFQVVDKFTGGGLKGFVQSFVPRGEGLKIMNALDLEKALGKNLKLIQKALKTQDEKEIIKILNQLIKTEQPKLKALPAPGGSSAPLITPLPENQMLPREKLPLSQSGGRIEIAPTRTNRFVARQKKIAASLTPQEKDSYLRFKQQAISDFPEFRTKFQSIGKELGLETKLDFKSDGRAIEKAYDDYGKRFDATTDMIRAHYIADDFAKMRQTLGKIKDNFSVISVKNRFENPTLGYRDVLVKVRLSNGTVGEIQLLTPEMAKAKEANHILYESTRLPLKNKPTANLKNNLLESKQNKAYSEAWQKSASDYQADRTNWVGLDKSNSRVYNSNVTLKQAIDSLDRSGGFTYSTKTGESLAGKKLYSVSPFPERSRILPKDKVTQKTIYEFARDNDDILRRKGFAVGGWHNKADGKVYLDVVVAVPDKEAAVKIGRKNNQIAAFDLGAMEEIPTGGTGLPVRPGKMYGRIKGIQKLVNK